MSAHRGRTSDCRIWLEGWYTTQTYRMRSGTSDRLAGVARCRCRNHSWYRFWLPIRTCVIRKRRWVSISGGTRD